MSKTRHFLSLDGLTIDKINQLLEFSIKLKTDIKNKKQYPYLQEKILGMIFEKPSCRTRISFEAGMYQLGGKAIYMQGNEVGIGSRESASDISRVLSRYLDIVMYRANCHQNIVEMAEYSSIPIINGLSDYVHPCQIMADMLTVLECKKHVSDIRLCYIGDGNNVCNSLIIAADIMNINLVVSCPKEYEPKMKRGNYEIISDPEKAVYNADVVYTDVWVSMGQEAEKEKKLNSMQKYSVTMDLMSKAASNAIFLHCLPAHRGEEVTSEVMGSAYSKVFDQAENRMHAQKAILVDLLCPDMIK
ncbi:ornithine carbamoyltransferase [Candidatus Margulisiibacteriota bacterium]